MVEFYHWDQKEKYFLVYNVGSPSAILANTMQIEGFEVQIISGGMDEIS